MDIEKNQRTKFQTNFVFDKQNQTRARLTLKTKPQAIRNEWVSESFGFNRPLEVFEVSNEPL